MDYHKLAEEALKDEKIELYCDNIYKLYKKDENEKNKVLYEKSLKLKELYNEAKKLLDIKENDHYKILGINKEAKTEEINSKFMRLMNKFHPDKSKLKICNTLTSRIMKAHDILKDENKRKEYDNRSLYRTESQRFHTGSQENGQNIDISDFIRMFQRNQFYGSNFSFESDPYIFMNRRNRIFRDRYGNAFYNSNVPRNRDELSGRFVILIVFLFLFLFQLF